MRLVISNIHWPLMPEYSEGLRNEIFDLMMKDINKFGVKCLIEMDNNSIVFRTETALGKKAHLFMSISDNKVKFNPEGDMVKKKGRLFGKSKRLTEKQWNDTTGYIIGLFDKLQLNADINLYKEDLPGGSPIVIRKDKVSNRTAWPKPASFTL